MALEITTGTDYHEDFSRMLDQTFPDLRTPNRTILRQKGDIVVATRPRTTGSGIFDRLKFAQEKTREGLVKEGLSDMYELWDELPEDLASPRFRVASSIATVCRWQTYSSKVPASKLKWAQEASEWVDLAQDITAPGIRNLDRVKQAEIEAQFRYNYGRFIENPEHRLYILIGGYERLLAVWLLVDENDRSLVLGYHKPQYHLANKISRLTQGEDRVDWTRRALFHAEEVVKCDPGKNPQKAVVNRVALSSSHINMGALTTEASIKEFHIQEGIRQAEEALAAIESSQGSTFKTPGDRLFFASLAQKVSTLVPDVEKPMWEKVASRFRHEALT